MYVDAGDAGELRKVVLNALSNNTTFPVVADQPRTLRVVHMTHTKTELKAMTWDEGNKEFVALHIPHDRQDDSQSLRATADIGNRAMHDGVQ